MRPCSFAICVDFPDELLNGWFDRRRLFAYFSRFKDMGMERVYWIDEPQYEFPRWYPDCALTENIRRTRENLGPFLPAAVEISRALGMTLYAVVKPFELGSAATLPFDDPDAKNLAGMRNLSGRFYGIHDSVMALWDKRLERHPADLTAGPSRFPRVIKLRSRSPLPPELTRDDFQLSVSANNREYVPYPGEYAFRYDYEKDDLCFYFENLTLAFPYWAIRCVAPTKKATFANRLRRLLTLYDDKGDSVPFTYGLTRRDRYHRAKNDWGDRLDGYLFDYHGLATNDHFLDRTTVALDGEEIDGLAFAIGKEKYIATMLSPAYPESRDCWLGHIRRCLDAGVDGVDLRVGNHNRCLEWERYGFEAPVREAYLARTGQALAERYDARVHRQILGDFYSDFCRAASRMTRAAGKRFQAHIGRDEMFDSFGRRYQNFRFQWETWLDEKLLDAITIKGGPWFDPIRWETVKNRLSPTDSVESFYCPYWATIGKRPDWPRRLREALTTAFQSGVTGFILYESAMVFDIAANGEFTFKYPEITEIIKNIQKEHSA